MRRLAVVIATLSMQAGAVLAQKPEVPQPGPEHQRLGAFVGNWTFENFFVQRLYQGKAPMGEVQGLEILGYDAVKKVYTSNSFDSIGMRGSGTMTVNGNTWSLSGTETIGTIVVHDRCTLDFGAGNTTLTVKCEGSVDGKSWVPTFEGKATKK